MANITLRWVGGYLIYSSSLLRVISGEYNMMTALSSRPAVPSVTPFSYQNAGFRSNLLFSSVMFNLGSVSSYLFQESVSLYHWNGSLRRVLYTDTASQHDTRLTDWITIIPEERPRSLALFIQGNNETKWIQAAVDKHGDKCQYTLVGAVPSKLFNKNFWTQLIPIFGLQKQKNDNHIHQKGSWNDD